MKNKKRVLNIIFWGIGIALITYMVYRADPALLFSRIKTAGAGIILLLIAPIFWFVAHAQATRFTLNAHNRKKLTLPKLTLLQAISYGVAWSQPFQGAVGEPLKLFLLDNKKHDKNDFTASLLIDNTINLLANALTTFLAISVVLISEKSTPTLRVVVASFMLLTILIFILIITIQKKGIFTKAITLLSKFQPLQPFAEKNKEKFSEIDTAILLFYKERRKDFLGSLFFHVLERLHGIFEFYLIFSLIYHPVPLITCLAIYGIVNGLDNILFFIQIGGMESYTALLLKGLTLTAEKINFAVPLFRRVRIIFWVFVAFLLIKPAKKLLSR